MVTSTPTTWANFSELASTWRCHSSVKRRGIIMIVLSFTFSIVMVPLWWHKAMLLIGMAVLLYCFNRLPVVELQPDSASVAEADENP